MGENTPPFPLSSNKSLSVPPKSPHRRGGSVFFLLHHRHKDARRLRSLSPGLPTPPQHTAPSAASLHLFPSPQPSLTCHRLDPTGAPSRASRLDRPHLEGTSGQGSSRLHTMGGCSVYKFIRQRRSSSGARSVAFFPSRLPFACC